MLFCYFILHVGVVFGIAKQKAYVKFQQISSCGGNGSFGFKLQMTRPSIL